MRKAHLNNTKKELNKKKKSKTIRKNPIIWYTYDVSPKSNALIYALISKKENFLFFFFQISFSFFQQDSQAVKLSMVAALANFCNAPTAIKKNKIVCVKNKS